MLKPMHNLKNLFKACPHKHDSENIWQRPPFCECKPISGSIDEISMGLGRSHTLLEDDDDPLDYGIIGVPPRGKKRNLEDESTEKQLET